MGNAFQSSVPETPLLCWSLVWHGKEAVFQGTHHLGTRRVK